MQRYVFELEPSLLMQGGLTTSLGRLVTDFETTANIATSLEIDPKAIEALEAEPIHVLQMVREALSNVRRHSQAQHVGLRVRKAGRASVLEIRDDGQGFSPEVAHGLGLQNLRTRAKLLGGTLEVQSEPGKGALVRVTVPVATRESQPNVASALA
jgi:signal transduction histidine kinase